MLNAIRDLIVQRGRARPFLRAALLLALLSIPCFAQPVIVRPDCVIPFHFTTVSQTSPISPHNGLDNRATGCQTWSVSFSSQTFTAVSITLQSAPNTTASGAPGTYATYANQTVDSGANPLVGTGAGAAGVVNLRGYNPWVRILFASATGTGTVDGIAFGWAIPSASASAGAFANRHLSNLLSPTAVNQDLLPGTAYGQKLGSLTDPWGLMVAGLKDATTGASDAPARQVVTIHDSTLTPIEVDTGIAGFSTGYEWRLKNAAGTVIPVIRLDALMRIPDAGAEVVAAVLSLVGGAGIVPSMIIDPNNARAGLGNNAFNSATSTGGADAALGDGALGTLTTGITNTAVGNEALSNVTTGSGNVAIGNFACATNNTDNAICIGDSVVDAGSNTGVIGNASMTDVYFGSAAGLATIHGVVTPAIVPSANKIGNSAKFQLGAPGAVPGDCPTFDANLNITGPGTGAGCLSSGTAGGGVVVYSGLAGVALTGTLFFPIGGGSQASTTETTVDADIQASTTISRLGANISTALGVGNSVVFTWRKNASDQTLTCTISGASATSCGDSVNSFSVVPGDLLSIKAVFSGTIVVAPVFVLSTQTGTLATGLINTGTTGQVAAYTAGGTTLGGVGPGTTTTVLHGNAAGQPSYGNVVNADIAASTIDLTTKVTGILPSANSQPHSISFVIDGGGSVISTGDIKIYPTVDFACTINRIDISADQSGSITVDVWKAAGAIPTSGNKISASAPLTLSSAQLAQNGSRSGWSAGVSVGDVFGFSVATVATVTRVVGQIWCQ